MLLLIYCLHKTINNQKCFTSHMVFKSGLTTADLNATGNDAVEIVKLIIRTITSINKLEKFYNNRVGNGSNIHVVLFILDNNTLISSTFVCLK